MIRRFHHRRNIGRILRVAAMYFDPYLDAASGSVIAQFAETRADVGDRSGERHFLRNAVGAHLDSPSSCIVSEVDEALRLIDILATDSRIRRMELARCAVAEQTHFAAGEAGANP